MSLLCCMLRCAEMATSRATAFALRATLLAVVVASVKCPFTATPARNAATMDKHAIAATGTAL
eukprot:6213795-Pleurochrysis_carterae.AAC.1